MIVVVDDDDDVRGALCEILHGEGYPTVGARNGREALAWLRGGHPRPELILLDLMMPVMDGWAFLSGIEADPALKGIPVALMSAHPTVHRAFAAANRDGSSAHLLLPKPLHVLRLLSTVRTMCTAPTGRAQAPD